MNLGDKYSGHSLIERCSVQGQRGRHGHYDVSQMFVHVEIVLQAVESDGQSDNTGRKKDLCLYNTVVRVKTVISGNLIQLWGIFYATKDRIRLSQQSRRRLTWRKYQMRW